MHFYIRESGYFVETRSRCDEIIQDVIDTSPDVILLNLKIPFLGGAQAIRHLKEIQRRTKFPWSCFLQPEAWKTSPEVARWMGLLEKPFDINILVKVVNNKV